MSDEELEVAWEAYQAEMVQIMAEKMAILHEDTSKVDTAELSDVRKRLGLA